MKEGKKAITALAPLKKYRFKVFLAPCLKLIECIMELASPFLVRYIIDEGISNKNWDYTWKLGLILFIASLLGFLATMIAQYLASSVASSYAYDLRKCLFKHKNELSEKQLSTFGKEKTLTLITNDAFAMQNGVMMFMRLIFRPPFLLIGATIISLIISWQFGLIFFGVSLGSSLVIGLVIFLAPKRYAKIQSNIDKISIVGNDTLKGARPIRAFNKEEESKMMFENKTEEYKQSVMEMAKYNALINPLTFFFVNLGIILVVYFGDLGVENGILKTGEIVALISYLVTSLAALVMFSRLIVSLNKASASKKRIDSFLALAPTIVNEAKYQKEDEVANAPLIEFKNVSLTYGKEGERAAVSNLSFRIEKGMWVGLIGGTGSGKSTTIALLERLYDPSEGEIFYRGLPLKKYDLISLRKEIALVLQKPSLFKGSIRSNLLIAKPNASEEEIVIALKEACAYEFVASYSDFLDHPVEEGGSNLSGGQKQRLLIARALLSKSDILILDDSTSALDFLSDQAIRNHLSKVKSLTKIIISQRASSLKDCDLILVYEGGKILARGKHQELLKNSSIYAEIDAIQKKGEASENA